MSQYTQIFLANEGLATNDDERPIRSTPFEFECTACDDMFDVARLQQTTLESADTATLVVSFDE